MVWVGIRVIARDEESPFASETEYGEVWSRAVD